MYNYIIKYMCTLHFITAYMYYIIYFILALLLNKIKYIIFNIILLLFVKILAVCGLYGLL